MIFAIDRRAHVPVVLFQLRVLPLQVVMVAKAFGYDSSRPRAVRLAELDLVPAWPPDLAFDTRRARVVLHNPPRRLYELLEALAAATAGC